MSMLRLAPLAVLCASMLVSCTSRGVTPLVNTPAPTLQASATVPPTVAQPTASPLPQPSPTLTPEATIVSGPPTIVPTEQRGADPVGPIYYIDGRQQLSRVAADGTIDQLTRDVGNLLDFDVSPADGSIAYLLFESPSKMALVQIDKDGGKRSELATGVMRQLLYDPAGTQLVFAVDLAGAKAGTIDMEMGVWSIPADGGPATLLLANTPAETAADGSLVPGLRNAPAAWSPDGTQLLLYTAPDFGPDAPAGDIGVVGLSLLNMADQTTTELIPPGGNPRLCLVPTWDNSGKIVYCATPYNVGDETPALFQIDLADQTQRELIARIDADERAVAVQGVRGDQQGVTALFSYSRNAAPLGAAFERFTSDPAKRTVVATAALVPEFTVPVLWAPDGRGAAFAVGGEAPALVWQPFDGGQPRVLVQDLVGRTRWGK